MFQHPNPYSGKLIIVEGIDGSGKSTQLRLLKSWLEAKGYPVFLTEWNSSDLVKQTTKEGKKKKTLTPTTFSLLHATDFADRHSQHILPPLKAGMIVLADRYAYTAFSRDVVRGVDRQWIRKMYQFAIQPDLALYFRVPLEVAIDRILSGRPKLKYYEAGMDMNLSSQPEESFRLFQGMILKEYESMISEFGFTVIDAALDIQAQQKIVREAAASHLEGFHPRRRRYGKTNQIFW